MLAAGAGAAEEEQREEVALLCRIVSPFSKSSTSEKLTRWRMRSKSEGAQMPRLASLRPWLVRKSFEPSKQANSQEEIERIEQEAMQELERAEAIRQDDLRRADAKRQAQLEELRENDLQIWHASRKIERWTSSPKSKR